MEGELESILKKILENPNNKVVEKSTITIYNGEDDEGFGEKTPIPVVTLNLTDKYAQFHGEFVQTAFFNEELKPLMNYINFYGYDSNLD